MWFVDSQDSTLPQINLAIEEYLLRNILPEEDLLFLYVNEPSIIVGRFQNTLEEINQAYVEDHGIHVVRRLSGGGAVYHDLNNLNYSFITAKDPESISNFKKFTAPVIRTLNEMG
ncbi:MAG TPA: lipoate--protein ligase family protein, partial [Levilinea sp.]|nr:lipoate--protein ligase family protein [Levilinea sp.]